MDYLFSTADVSDADAVYTLYRSMIGTPHNTWSDEYPTKEIVLADIRSQALYLLKDADDHLVAAAAAGFDDRELTNLPWHLQNPCEIARVAVAIPHQNQDVGSYLLQKIIPAIKAKGYDGICMLVSQDHPHALALYEKNGFTRCGEVHRYGFDFFRYRMAFQG